MAVAQRSQAELAKIATDDLEKELTAMRKQIADQRAQTKGVVKDVSEVLKSIAESHNFYDSQRMAAEALEWLSKT